MGAYRLEVWFNYPQGTIDWGIAQAAAGGSPPFRNGGTALPKNSQGVVTINGAGGNSTFDIYVFDVSNDQVARTLQSIQIDYEKAGGAGPGQGNNPIGDAAALRRSEERRVGREGRARRGGEEGIDIRRTCGELRR